MALGVGGQAGVARALAVWRSVAIQFDDYLAATGTLPEMRRAHLSELKHFAGWAASRGYAPIDADHRLVRRYAEHLSNTGSKGAAALARRAGRLQTLKGFFRFTAVRAEHGDGRRASPMDGGRAEQAPHPIGGVKLRHLLAGVSEMTPLETRDRAIAGVARSCGLRAAEIAGLDIADVSEEGGGLVLGRASDGSSAMRLERAASEALGVYLVRGRPALSIDGDDAALFLSRAGRRLSERRVARCLRMSMRGRAALGDWRP